MLLAGEISGFASSIDELHIKTISAEDQKTAVKLHVRYFFRMFSP
jgi:hypothetical protein